MLKASNFSKKANESESARFNCLLINSCVLKKMKQSEECFEISSRILSWTVVRSLSRQDGKREASETTKFDCISLVCHYVFQSSFFNILSPVKQSEHFVNFFSTRFHRHNLKSSSGQKGARGVICYMLHASDGCREKFFEQKVEKW